jgi:hypothetical protein
MFYEYIDGELVEDAPLADFEHHLEHCRSCFTRAEFEGLLTERLKLLAGARASDGLRHRLQILMESF